MSDSFDRCKLNALIDAAIEARIQIRDRSVEVQLRRSSGLATAEAELAIEDARLESEKAIRALNRELLCS
jgi:hypothetical protein